MAIAQGAGLNALRMNKSWAGKVISQAQFAQIAEAHSRFLDRRPGGARALLASAKMSELDISRRRLGEADFSGADLTGACFRQSNLQRATLFCADLRHTDLSHCDLKYSDLRGACLAGADLSFSKLDGADLRTAVMLRRDADGCYTRTLKPEKAHVDGGVDFSNCSMIGASLNDVNLMGANFRNAILSGVTFKRAKLVDVNLNGAVLTNVNIAELPFSAAEMKTCVFDPTPQAVARIPILREKLSMHELWFATNGKDGEPALLDGEDIRLLGNNFRNRKLTAIVARGAVALGVDFSNCELQGANFENADLREAKFDGADLRGAVFCGAKLAHASFDNADLRTLLLPNGAPKPIDLAGADFAKTQFQRALL